MQSQRLRQPLVQFSLYAAVALIAAAAAIPIQNSFIGRFVELRAYDLRFQLSSRPQTSPPIAIIGIDEESLQAIPDPLLKWNGHVATIIEGLVEGGAAVAGIDFLFADTTDLYPEGQQALAVALIDAGDHGLPVVMGYRVRDSGTVDLPAAIQMSVMGSGHPVGFLNLTTDPDDFIRRQRLNDGQPRAPSFANAAASAYNRKRAAGPTSFAADEILIDYLKPGAIPVVSFVRALTAAKNHETAFLQAQFKDRIVLIGRYGGPSDEDLHPTPRYYRSGRPVTEPRSTQGVLIHANVVRTLVEGRFIERLGPRPQLALQVAIVLAMTLVCALLPWLRAIVAGTAVLIAVLYYGLVVSFSGGTWVWLVGPLAGGVIAAGSTMTLNYVLEGRDKKRIRNLFRRYVKEEVIQQILEQPESLVLHGERKHITVMFADIKGFTPLSESSSPEAIVTLLNVYFKEVVDAIQENHGMVNSLMGDGLMALFGVPVDDPDSSLHAVQAGIAMHQALVRVNATLLEMGLKEIGIGVGIHCGDAIVGNMGSPEMMEYTAIGDVVNTAARIEGLTRSHAADIVITGAVQTALNDRIPSVLLGDDFKVKGKDERLRIYKVEASPL